MCLKGQMISYVNDVADKEDGDIKVPYWNL